MNEIKLVSYNLDHSSKKNKLVQNIRKLSLLGTNIFCFQEIRTGNPDEFIGNAILDALGSDWKGEFLISENSKNDYGLGIIWNSSELELDNFQALDFPLLPQLFHLDRLVEQYLLSGDATPVKRAALIATFQINGQQFRLSNVHADWHGGFEHRFNQIQFLLNHLKTSDIKSEIICGDFNTIGLFRSYKQIKKIQELLGSEFINFFPKHRITSIHGQRLDHVFARNFNQNSAKVHLMLGSDHFPIMVSMTLDNTEKDSEL